MNVPSPDGRPWGLIKASSNRILATSFLTAGKIVVPRGDQTFGLTHIVERHKDHINNRFGSLSIEDYLLDILRSYNEIYFQASNGRYILIRDKSLISCAVVERVFTIDSSVEYALLTAYPLRKMPDVRKKGWMQFW